MRSRDAFDGVCTCRSLKHGVHVPYVLVEQASL